MSKKDSGIWQDLDEATLAHYLAHSYANLRTTIQHVKEELERPAHELTEDRLQRARGGTERALREVESQLHQNTAVLQYLLPDQTAGLQRPEFERCSPYTVLVDMTPSYAELARRKQVELTLAAEADGEQFPSLWVESNTVRRAFHHVLSNAVKYSYRGSRRNERYIRVWFERHDAQGHLWAVKVQNYGLGVLEEELPAIMKPGVRGEMAREDNTFGTGLGLADARFCMRLHRGYLRLQSRPLEGGTYLTTVTLVFRRWADARGSFRKQMRRRGRAS